MRNLILPLVILVFIGDPLTVAQSQSQSRIEFTASEVSSPVPVVFGRKDDGLPEKMGVRGVIKDLTFISAGCGGVAWAGTLRIRLDEKISGYSPEDVFVVVGCFPDFEKFGYQRDRYLNQSVMLTVSKLYPEYQFGVFADINKVPCPFDLITNKINSKGVPFYCTNENISDGIETSLKYKTNRKGTN